MNFKEIIRLLTEYHLFLYKNFEEMAQKTVVKFLSPCGVSFILIKSIEL